MASSAAGFGAKAILVFSYHPDAAGLPCKDDHTNAIHTDGANYFPPVLTPAALRLGLHLADDRGHAATGW